MSDLQTIISLISGAIGIVILITKPMLSLTKTLTEVNFSLQSMKEKFEQFKKDNDGVHENIWDCEKRQDIILQTHNDLLIQHENRLHDLDGRGE